MKLLTITLLSLLWNPMFLLAQPHYQRGQNTIAAKDLAWIKNSLTDYVDKYEIPAVAVGIVKDGSVEAFLSVGTLKKRSDQKVNEHTLFQLASLSKSFTGIMANQLMMEGKLDTSASITHYLKGSLSPEAERKLEVITIKDVLLHQSGIPRGPKNGAKTPFGLPAKKDYDESDMLKGLELIITEFEPGEKFSYSNFGYGILGYILERITGQSYEALLQERIVKRYGLSATTTLYPAPHENPLATPYIPGFGIKTSPWKFGKLVGAGGVFSNIHDLSKLMIAQMNDYQLYESTGKLSPLILNHTTRPMNNSGSVWYGFGMIGSQSPIDSTIRHLGHSGDVDGFASSYSFCPEKQTGLIMLTSSGGRWFWEMERQINKKLLGLPVYEEVKIDPEILARYTGTYRFKQVDLKIWMKNDELWSQTLSKGSPRHRLFAAAENKLFYKAFDAEFEFVLDENDQIEKIIYTQSGRTSIPTKIK